MNDPMAPDGYCFENQGKLDECLQKLRDAAEELNELSFGDASVQIERAVYGIEHHTKEDTWTRLSRASHARLLARLAFLPHPHVSIRHGHEGAPSQLCVDFPIKLDGSVTDFIEKFDPGNAFDRLCPICDSKPGHPCTGPNSEPDLPVHAERRFPGKLVFDADTKIEPENDLEIDYGDFPHARGHERDVYETEDGQLRYRENKVIGWIKERGDRVMSEIMSLHCRDLFSMEDMMEFYRLIGYSLDGFEEIWQQKDPATRTYECHGCDNAVPRGVTLCEECS
jgi:hypothetical protein